VAAKRRIGFPSIFLDYVRKLWDPLKWLTEFVVKVQDLRSSGAPGVPDSGYARDDNRLARTDTPACLGDIGLETVAMASTQLGRLADARTAVEAILKRTPMQSVASLRVVYGHHQRQEDLDHRLTALRDAGLPEWCYNFSGRLEDRLDAAAIHTIAMNKTWTGHLQNGAPFLIQFSSNGDFALRSQTGMAVGKFTFERDLLCTQSSAVMLGRKFLQSSIPQPWRKRRSSE
jgi:hypothetical protein